MLYTQFYRENKDVIDAEILPFISNNLCIVGGRHKVMFKPWAWDLAQKLQESKCFMHLIRNPIYANDEDGHTIWNYARMETNFALLGRLVLEKIYKQNGSNFHFPV